MFLCCWSAGYRYTNRVEVSNYWSKLFLNCSLKCYGLFFFLFSFMVSAANTGDEWTRQWRWSLLWVFHMLHICTWNQNGICVALKKLKTCSIKTLPGTFCCGQLRRFHLLSWHCLGIARGWWTINLRTSSLGALVR